MRSEQAIFEDLAKLCAHPGYAHAIAYFCFRDNFVGYARELRAKDSAKLYGNDRLVRTEISTLIGLMLRVPRDLTLPTQERLGEFVQQTESLLKELHDAMNEPIRAARQRSCQLGARCTAVSRSVWSYGVTVTVLDCTP